MAGEVQVEEAIAEVIAEEAMEGDTLAEDITAGDITAGDIMAAMAAVIMVAIIMAAPGFMEADISDSPITILTGITLITAIPTLIPILRWS
jgi:hypothetical protein